MDWAKQFYAAQDAWLGIYSGEVNPTHRDTAALVRELLGNDATTLLELGAGGGQNAAALADAGFDVTAIELVESAAENIGMLSRQRPSRQLKVLQGDFYALSLPTRFDAVAYFDGFGIGSDADQRRLLQRIADEWLEPNGRAIIEVFTPWYWAAAAGRTMQFGAITRRYDFDADGSRMLDRWWQTQDEASAVTQSLRCYSPADLRLLVDGLGLQLEQTISRGAFYYEEGRFDPAAPLAQAMSYWAVIKRTPANA